ncbi:MAG TPA: PAS domain-containing protein [Dongiaceae bacterium]
MIAPHLMATGNPLLESPELNFAAKPSVPKLCELLTIWQGWPKLGGVAGSDVAGRDVEGSGLPSREQFEPADMPHLLPDIGLAEIDRHSNLYRDYDVLFRYIGSRIGEDFKMSQRTRQHLSDFGLQYAHRWFPVFDRLLATGLPVALQGVPYLIEKDYLRFEMVFLPLAGSKVSPTDEIGPSTISFVLFAAHFRPNTGAGSVV